ncbi:hypothetical protein PPTG_03880 [Phytophthora nicotianae INRA-310]|uniref:BED-type domain-containing protein n=3 Tax=Phytophthora nicotianae TaxID=4792 RepID=W2R130_PHYN3|nr:hypothetical protein PPTG_03880 [Phytophthora nicotianae INRA-310]ETN18210.1 hypothetical protein PPTG_03880 [Phytophthora nicotianae INRA-310]
MEVLVKFGTHFLFFHQACNRNCNSNPPSLMNSEVVSLSTSTPATHDTPSPAPTAGRNRKPVWDLMDVDGKDVLCKRCGKLVHASGRTHVERVEKHVYSRCEKRLSSYKITDIYQSIMNTAVLKQ